MYGVCVTFQLKPDNQDAFMPLMQANARTSLTKEPGCLQFDVLSCPDKPDQVFLYELYTDRAALDAHLAADHFKSFDAATAPTIADKHVQLWSRVDQ